MQFRFPYLYLAETESTNKLASELVSKINPPEGYLIITDYQTAGKGQYGRIWHSERSKNLLASLIFRPKWIQIDEIFRLHLISSLAIIRSLKLLSLKDLFIKPPNDIYIGSKKLGGILIQNTIKEAEIQWTIIGIGINVNQTEFPPELNASSILLHTGKETEIQHLIILIRDELLQLFSTNKESDWNELLSEYNSHLYKNEI